MARLTSERVQLQRRCARFDLVASTLMIWLVVTGTIAGWIYWLIVMVNSDGYSLLNSIGNIRVIWLVVTGTMEFYDFPYTGNSNPN